MGLGCETPTSFMPANTRVAQGMTITPAFFFFVQNQQNRSNERDIRNTKILSFILYFQYLRQMNLLLAFTEILNIPFGPRPPVFGKGSGLIVYSLISDIFFFITHLPVVVLGSSEGGRRRVSSCLKNTEEL